MDDEYSRALAEVEAAPDRETAQRLYQERLFPLALARIQGKGGRASLLVLTVGNQPWSVALSLAATRAPRVLAIHTVESERNLVKALSLLPPELKPEEERRRLVERADSTQVYQAIREALDRIALPLEDVVIDFTSGTKAMTAGASTFAGFRRLRQVYVASEPLQGEAARGLFGRERVHQVDHPLVVLGEPDRLEAERAFQAGNFDLAARLFEELERARVPGFHFAARARLARAYQKWDTLGFAEAAQELGKIVDDLEAAPRSNLRHESLLDQVDRLREQADHCQTLAQAIKDRKDKGSPSAQPKQVNALLRWLLAGARRATPRRLDLAALLTYRALELALQRRLAVHGLDASNFQPNDPEELLERYNGLAGERHTLAKFPDKLGLAQSWFLLLALRDPVIQDADIRDDRLLGVIEARNHSVLAHGFGTVSEKTVNNLREVVVAVARRVVDDDRLPLPDPDDGFDFVRLE